LIKGEVIPRYCKANSYRQKTLLQHSQADSSCAEEPQFTWKEEVVLQ